MAPHILSLPLEIRLHIYSYLHSTILNLDFCSVQQDRRLEACTSKTRPSPLLAYLNRRHATTVWVREFGLHLLTVHPTMRSEYVDLLERTGTKLIIHCTSCLDRLLCHLHMVLGLRRPFLKNVWLQVDFQGSVTWDHGTVMEGVIKNFRDVMSRWFGNSELLCEDYEVEKSRRWRVEWRKTVGRLPRRKAKRDMQEPTGEDGEDMVMELAGDDEVEGEEFEADTDDDVSDLNDDHFHWSLRRYEYQEDVKVLESETKVWDISDAKGSGIEGMRRKMQTVFPASRDNEWRRSERTEREWRQRGKKVRRLVIREEIWLGCKMG